MSRTTTAPVARREERVIRQHGEERVDPYDWMKDENWQAVLRDPDALRPDVAEHLRAENRYVDAVLADTAALQAAIENEMAGRLQPDDRSVPAPDGAWEYYWRYEPGAQHPVHARCPRGGGAEQVLLDAQEQSAAHEYYAVAAAEHDPTHRFYAWAEDTQGSEVFRIRVRDLETGAVLPEAIESTAGDFCFSGTGDWIFWVFRDENARPTRIFRRPTRGGADILVYEEKDPGFFLGVSLSRTRDWIVIEARDQETSEAWLVPGREPEREPVLVAPRAKGERYELSHWRTAERDGFVVLTNRGGSVDFQLMWTPADQPGREHWRPLVAHRPGHFILGAACFAGHLAWIERREVNTRILHAPAAAARDGAELRDAAIAIAAEEEAYALSLEGSLEYDTAVLRYGYQSPTTPRHTYDYDMADGSRTLRKVQAVPSGHDPARYRTTRLWATAADGERVPVTVLHGADTPRNGTAPLLLYGYGSYGHSIEAGFSTRVLSLVDRGWIYAIAHVRGGSEKGWTWFLDGRGSRKPNTFSDFVACARHLAAAGYGSAGGIVAQGGSAGGLLVGAAANLAPDLFCGVVAQVPFVDALNTMSDASLPLTPPEWPEWGNPIEDAGAFATIRGYSPYDNVGPLPYPAILATGGLSDPRVTYWEPAKWVARLRELGTGKRPVLCRINMEAGHGGASGRFGALKEAALVQAFAIWSFQTREVPA
ncbi:MAG: S9 family peptidase [Gluconacetobacter diazotrophicus]|nr:S9 family peptidase [Gluconacetobacter diazotrophicus]